MENQSVTSTSQSVQNSTVKGFLPIEFTLKVPFKACFLLNIQEIPNHLFCFKRFSFENSSVTFLSKNFFIINLSHKLYEKARY